MHPNKTTSIFPFILFLSISIGAQNNVSPDWSKGVIWYQIFPERFNNVDMTQNSDQLSTL